MNRLPNIFHGENNYKTNNKKSFINYNKDKSDSKINKDFLANYFNKEITVVLKSGKDVKGILLSKRENIILLDTGDYISLDDILEIK